MKKTYDHCRVCGKRVKTKVNDPKAVIYNAAYDVYYCPGECEQKFMNEGSTDDE